MVFLVHLLPVFSSTLLQMTRSLLGMGGRRGQKQKGGMWEREREGNLMTVLDSIRQPDRDFWNTHTETGGVCLL